jgi:hypothetical protein
MSANSEYEEKASLGAATMSENLGELPNPPSLYRLLRRYVIPGAFVPWNHK